MKKTIFFLLYFLLGVVLVNAQEKTRHKELSKKTMQYYYQAKDCWNNTEDSCIPFYEKMVQSAKQNKECVPCAEVELAKGYYDEFNIDLTISHSINVIKDAKDFKNSLKWELEQDAYQLIAVCYSLKGDIQKSITNFIEAGKRSEKLGNKEQLAQLKGNLGVLYIDMKNYEEGIKYQKEAVKKLNEIGKINKSIHFMANIASAYLDLNSQDSAMVWGKKTIRFAEDNNLIEGLVPGYYLTASAFLKTDIDSALYYIEKAIPLALKTKNNLYIATSFNIKGNIYAEKENYPKAKEYFLKSIEAYQKIGSPAGLYAPLSSLGKEAYLYKDFETASKYLYEYVIYQDSIVSKENRALVHELNTKYETERKEKLLAEQQLVIEQQQNHKRLLVLIGAFVFVVISSLFIVYKRNQKVKQQKALQQKEKEILLAFIEGEERERKRISHELHDGVASMLGVVKMNVEVFPHLPEEKKQEQLQKVMRILENTHSDVRHIAHNLLPLTLEKEGLINAVEQFASEINQTRILSINVTDNTKLSINLSLQKQLMLFRIIQELINNTIKHSQATKSEIEFSQNHNKLNIRIFDNGIGFITENITENQGLQSIKQRVASISGKSFFESTPKKGTEVMLELLTD